MLPDAILAASTLATSRTPLLAVLCPSLAPAHTSALLLLLCWPPLLRAPEVTTPPLARSADLASAQICRAEARPRGIARPRTVTAAI